MIKLQGKYSTAKVFTDNIDQTTSLQIIKLCDQDFTKDCKIRIMPDTHAGMGCVIGFTANLGSKVIPNIVGVDLGCGMLTVELGCIDINLEALDNFIHEYIPSGFNVHKGRIVKFDKLQELYYYRNLKDTKRIERSIGTLGGGNHFIEVDKDSNDRLYLVIHSGSRNLGKQVADYYQNIAVDLCSGKENYYKESEDLIREYKESGRRKLIRQALIDIKKKYEDNHPNYPKELCFLECDFKDKYLHDMSICQEYAEINREAIAGIITEKLLNKKLSEFPSFHTIHNYISFKDNIIRKGAVSAYNNERLLIPINMRDGSLLCKGKGNSDWNWSAPHGAGRLMSRTEAKKSIKLDEFKESMNGIFTTSANEFTLDESAMAYKPMEDIVNNIQETVEIIDILKPIYNFKANE